MERQFVESIKRLYETNKIKKDKVITLYKDGKITESEMKYILSAH